MLAILEAGQLAMMQARTGERISQAEFETFYLRTARTLHGYLCRLSRDPSVADEVTQEAYIRMIALPPMEEIPRKAYLYKTATNILRDRWRRHRREVEWSASTNLSEAVHSDFNLSIDMEAVLDQLNIQERAVLWLAHVEELSHREIASVLGVKEKSVRVIVFRAREKARLVLENAGFGEVHE